MPRIEWSFDGDSFADGSGGDKFLMDISEKLSAHYGRLVRQSNTFTIQNVDIRIVNPNTTIQDQSMAVSGKLLYFEPTANRKKAWHNAFSTWLTNRKALGVQQRNADFRVGFGDEYHTDIGIGFGDTGVKFNAWINADDDPLCLTHPTLRQSIFGVWNRNVGQANPDPGNPTDGFGHWAQKDADALLDELDFVAFEQPIFYQDYASEVAQSMPFMVNFSAWFDDAQSDPSDFGSATNAEHIDGPLRAMCGLVGLYVDTTTVDDTETQTQDWRIEVSMDITRWNTILPKRSGKKKSKRGRK